MLTALALALLTQCQPGSNCQAASFYPTCKAVSTFPACNTSQRGVIRCALNGLDGGAACEAFCDGVSWQCVSTPSSGGGSTPAQIAAASGWFSDGGSTATFPQSLRVEVGYNGLFADGGMYVEQMGTSRPALSLRCNPNLVNHIEARDNSGSTLLAYFYAIAGTTGWVTNGLKAEGATGTVTANILKSPGVATASLPTCNGAAEGQNETDTDIDRLKFCDGSQYVYPVGNIAGHFPGQGVITPADNITIANQRMYSGGNVQRIGLASLLAGTAPGAETYTIDVYNNTTSTVLCTKAAVACTTSSISSADCANVQYAANDDIRVRVHCSTCTTCPMMNVNVEYQ